MMGEDADLEPATRGTDELDILDARGDLYLKVGEDVEKEPKTYLVCSKALARASPVFEKMLYGSFTESRPTDQHWTVELPEDHQEPTELLLHIAHGRFDEVPEQLEFLRLYYFLAVVDKYDAAGATRPWARGWLNGVRADTQNPHLLGIAYELGATPTFDAMARKIVAACLVDDDGDLVFGYACKNKKAYSYKLQNVKYLVPPGLLGDISSKRTTLLTTILMPYTSLYAKLKRVNRCSSTQQDLTAGRQCDSILFGSLIRSFAAQQIDLTTPEPLVAYRGSAAALQAVLPRLELYTAHSNFPVHPSRVPASAAGDLQDGLKKSQVLMAQVSFAKSKYGDHLRNQASKTGLAK
ncbi:hypothetical protein LZ30DRAFT_747861 [Colletotrichum cereale]|nr:hypothetical protein LZ30DRAFT_747861 [Colletotrichum cereale]